jgi:hypothetical protein
MCRDRPLEFSHCGSSHPPPQRHSQQRPTEPCRTAASYPHADNPTEQHPYRNRQAKGPSVSYSATKAPALPKSGGSPPTALFPHSVQQLTARSPKIEHTGGNQCFRHETPQGKQETHHPSQEAANGYPQHLKISGLTEKQHNDGDANEE